MSDETLITDEEIKRYNEKINRYRTKDFDLFLPEEISRKYIEQLDYEETLRLKEDIKDFLKNDSMKVDKSSGEFNWFKRKYDRRFNEKEKIKEKLASKLDVSTESGTMGSIQKLNLMPKNNTFNNMTRKQRLQSLRGIESQLNTLSPEQYKRNYLDALKNEFGEFTPEYEVIKSVVDKISGEELWLLYGKDSDLQIDFIYTGIEVEQRTGEILKAFNRLGYNFDEKYYQMLGAETIKILTDENDIF